MYKRNWVARITVDGLGYIPGYSGATEKEMEAAKALKMKIYCCPEIKEV